MCHPWLAAGVVCFIAAQVMRELRPVFRTPAPDGEAETGLLGTRVRLWFRARIDPLVDTLLDAGITANMVTGFQLVASVLCGAAYAAGWMFTAGWLLIASGTLDVVDGGMARKRGAAGPRGAFLDSVCDRYGEAAVFVGLAMHFRDASTLWLVLTAFFGASMVSYTRARAEALGVECRIGLMQRPERYVVLGFGSIASSLWTHLVCAPAPRLGLVIASICIVAVLANVTALQRAAYTLRRLR